MPGIADEVKERFPLIDYVRQIYGSQRVKKEGAVYRVLDCPLPGCNSKDGFTVYDKSNTYHCFNCGQSGTIIDLYMVEGRCDHKKAIFELADKLGLQYSKAERKDQDKIQKIKAEAVKYCHEALLKNKKAMEYITMVRGIEAGLIKRFKIGLSTGDILTKFSKKYKPEDLEKAGLARDENEEKNKKKKKKEPPVWSEYWPKGLIMFPHFVKGEVSYFTQKPLPTVKYKFQSKLEHRNPECHLYNQDIMQKSPDIIFVEGEFDLLQILQKVGFESVVATNGPLSEKQIKYINQPEFSQKKLYLLFDNDKAGKANRYRLIDKGNFKGWKIFKSTPSERYKDIDDQLRDSRDPKADFDIIIRESERVAEDSFRIVEDGGYLSVWRPGSTGRSERMERIANFVLRLSRQFFKPEGMHREIYLINEYQERSRPLILTPDDMLSLKAFRALCAGMGNFIYEGKEADLSTLWQYIFSKEGGLPIYEMDHIGYQRTHDFWILGNCGVKGDGTLKMAGDDGIIWDTYQGHRPFTGRAEDADLMKEEERDIYLPSLYPHDKGWEEFFKFLKKLYRNTGTYGSWLAAGWFMACVYGEEIFKFYRVFPLLFIYGKPSSGKNTLASLLMSMWGLSEIDIIRVTGASHAGMRRRLAYFSNMPVVADEYRAQEKESRKFDGQFRGVYDKTGSPLGDRKGTTITWQVPVRAMVCLLGEQRPLDSALKQRFLTVRLRHGIRKDDLLKELRDESQYLSGFILKLLQEKKKRKENVMAMIEKIRRLLEKKGYESRHALNYAIPTAVLWDIFGKNKTGEPFYDWVQKESMEEKEIKEEETPIMEFFSDVAVIIEQYKRTTEELVYFEKAKDSEKSADPDLVGYGWMHFPGIYNSWLMFCAQRRKDILGKTDLQQYLKEETWFIEKRNKKFPENITRHAMKFKIHRKETPAIVARIFGQEIEPVEEMYQE